MAFAAAPTIDAVSSDPAQLRLEAEVRRLLRRANDPLALSAVPLAQTICDVTGTPNAQKALQQVIVKAFAQVWPHEQLRSLLAPGQDATELGAAPSQAMRVSTRHLQRRRAKAVTILALHIRKLVGSNDLGDAEDGAGGQPDPLDAIAELVSDIEPAIAARILRLGGPQSAQRANALAVRACVDAGADLEKADPEFERRVFSPLYAVLEAQSKVINGNPSGAEQGLWPLFTRAARDVTDGPEVRFELEWLSFLRARQHGCVRQLERVATNLGRLAEDHPRGVSRSLLALAESRIRRGRLYDGIVLLDQVERFGFRKHALRQLASSSLMRAEIALQRGDAAGAERLATGAYMILRGRHRDAYACQTAMARASLRLRRPWPGGDDLEALAATAPDRVSLEIERSRHLIAGGFPEQGRDAARQCYRSASALEYNALAARAAATIGRTFGAQTRQRRHWYLRALSLLLVTRDRSIGCDLYVPDADDHEAAPCERFQDSLAAMLYAGLHRGVPQLAGVSGSEGHVALEFVHRLTAYVLGSTDRTDELSHAIEGIAGASGTYARFLMYFHEDVTEILETAYAALAGPRARSKVEERLSNAFGTLSQAVEPGDDVRRFLVG